MRHDVITPPRLAAVNGQIIEPGATGPDVLTSDWLVLLFDRLHDTGEVIGIGESRGRALGAAFDADLTEGRIAAIARVDTVVLAGTGPGRRTVLGPRRVPEGTAPTPSARERQRIADTRARHRLIRAVQWFAAGFASCATLICLGALAAVMVAA